MKIENNLSAGMNIYLEPEGTPVKLKPEQFIEIKNDKGAPDISIQIGIEKGQPYLQIWFEDDSKVLFEGEEIR